MLPYLAVLAVMLACFTGDVSAVTDEQFQDLSSLVLGMKAEIHDLTSVVRSQASEIIGLKAENLDLKEQLEAALDLLEADLAQNVTIEERVTLLELQMTDVQEDVTGLDENVNFLFGEQLIQDERLLNLEEENDQTVMELDQVEDEIESLQDTTLALDFRVTVLEVNGNNSINELKLRVETLEGTAADHEGEIEDLEGSIADHETRLTAAEENIQGLQMTDINHDARISALEENETIAFHAVLTSYLTIPDEAVVEFNEIVLNQGNGYDNTTGVFTVPPGGDGLYYFSTYLLVQHNEDGRFDMMLNDDVICTALGDHSDSGIDDVPQAMCSAVVRVVTGDEVKLVLKASIDNTPLLESTTFYYNGFNGFRI